MRGNAKKLLYFAQLKLHSALRCLIKESQNLVRASLTFLNYTPKCVNNFPR